MIHVPLTAQLTPLSGLSRTMTYGLSVGTWSCTLIVTSTGHTNMLGARGRAGWSSLEAAVIELTTERAAKAGPANLRLPVLAQMGGWAL
ncbi:hypothetical protein EHF33_20525 (plasmid) [Deinococcus psychrotolerans]|uniref:Uncharacterized protein n=1 Tax=Deinococcus psychrotolerans TaxID=2489213 RepID=A0A3G8YM10_9DEIO|nr:hypothetical protein [Deinococcus psychrotolerans]AZI45297.1 hypothetical protein EHF33_20525 [Deinococcus psychrotolerans]